MSQLHLLLSVDQSDKARLISTTCDAWQASNADAYFAATGHWIEEVALQKWELYCALIRFTLMNTSHSGCWLACVFYQIVKWLGIIHKVAWVTCDNASNNTTMLQWFESLINRSKHHTKSPKWEFNKYHIRYVICPYKTWILFSFSNRCMAHVINLATQVFLLQCSSTAHFDPENPKGHELDLFSDFHDVIGLLQAIGVKVQEIWFLIL